MHKKIVMCSFLCVLIIASIGIIPVFANVEGCSKLLAPCYTIDGIDRETLLIPIDSYLFSSDMYESESDIGIIEKWLYIKDSMRNTYLRSTFMHALSLYMANIDSPERDFMVSIGWTPRLADLAVANIRDKSFFSNIANRTDWSVDEYIDRCDLVKATILCKNGTERCFNHKDMEPIEGPCGVMPVPSLQQIIIYQCLMEIDCRDRANGYDI